MVGPGPVGFTGWVEPPVELDTPSCYFLDEKIDVSNLIIKNYFLCHIICQLYRHIGFFFFFFFKLKKNQIKTETWPPKPLKSPTHLHLFNINPSNYYKKWVFVIQISDQNQNFKHQSKSISWEFKTRSMQYNMQLVKLQSKWSKQNWIKM